jgi:hypothetical protein
MKKLLFLSCFLFIRNTPTQPREGDTVGHCSLDVQTYQHRGNDQCLVSKRRILLDIAVGDVNTGCTVGGPCPHLKKSQQMFPHLVNAILCLN